MNRRSFLRYAALAATGGLLAACAVPSAHSLAGEPVEPNPARVQLPPPQTGGDARAAPDAELEQFMALSALLTGVDDLNAALGRVYLDSLRQNTTLGIPIGEFRAQVAGSTTTHPNTLDEIARTGLFDRETTRTIADKITEYWFTGVYDTPEGEQAVATYVDALAWKTLAFTKPKTICGAYRFWTEAPESVID